MKRKAHQSSTRTTSVSTARRSSQSAVQTSWGASSRAYRFTLQKYAEGACSPELRVDSKADGGKTRGRITQMLSFHVSTKPR